MQQIQKLYAIERKIKERTVNTQTIKRYRELCAKTSSAAIMDNLSKGFSHYYKFLETDRDLQFKCLRKTYLTYLNSTLSGDTKKLSSHASDEVLKRHYIDERIINKAVKELEIFKS